MKALQEGTDLWLPAEAIQSFVAKQTAAPAVVEIVGPNKDGSLLLRIRAPLDQQGTIQFSADLKAWNSVGEATGAGFQQPVSILMPPGSTEGTPIGFWRFVNGKPAP